MTPAWSTTRWPIAAFIAIAFTAFPVHAQTVGQVVPITAMSFFQSVLVEMVDFAPQNGIDLTLFASHTAGGPLVARVPYAGVASSNGDVEAGIRPSWRFSGVPPGTYYVVMLTGIVATPSVPASAWTRFVVAGGCPSVPSFGVIDPLSGGQTPGTVRMFLSTIDGCATTYELDAGTTPGASDVARLTGLGQFLVAPTPPPGRYYVRVRGRNAAGVGAYSGVLPIAVPACDRFLGEEPPSGPTNLTASVAGNTVTLTWTRSTAPPGFPVTYQEVVRLGTGAGVENPLVLLSPSASSVSGVVASGTYLIGVRDGNACGQANDYDVIQFTVP